MPLNAQAKISFVTSIPSNKQQAQEEHENSLTFVLKKTPRYNRPREEIDLAGDIQSLSTFHFSTSDKEPCPSTGYLIRAQISMDGQETFTMPTVGTPSSRHGSLRKINEGLSNCKNLKGKFFTEDEGTLTLSTKSRASKHLMELPQARTSMSSSDDSDDEYDNEQEVYDLFIKITKPSIEKTRPNSKQEAGAPQMKKGRVASRVSKNTRKQQKQSESSSSDESSE